MLSDPGSGSETWLLLSRVDLVVLGARGKLSQPNFTLIENVGSAQWTYICVTSGQGGAHFICFIKLLLDS